VLGDAEGVGVGEAFATSGCAAVEEVFELARGALPGLHADATTTSAVISHARRTAERTSTGLLPM
jgi:hypothetical protein